MAEKTKIPGGSEKPNAEIQHPEHPIEGIWYYNTFEPQGCQELSRCFVEKKTYKVDRNYNYKSFKAFHVMQSYAGQCFKEALYDHAGDEMFFTDKIFFNIDEQGKPAMPLGYKFADEGKSLKLSTLSPNCYEVWKRSRAEKFYSDQN